MFATCKSRLAAFAMAGALAMGGVASSANVYAAASHENDLSNQSRSESSGNINRSAVARAAAEAMLLVAKARSALHRMDAAAATDELEKVGRKLDAIDAELPSTVVRHRVEIAEEHLDYEIPVRITHDLVAIRAALVELLDHLPAITVNRYEALVDDVQRDLDKGKRAAAKTSLHLLWEELSDSEVEVPVRTVRRYTAAAMADVARHDFEAADRALAMAEDSMAALTVGSGEALARASRALHRAEQQYAVRSYDRVERALDNAVAAFEQSAESENARAASMAKQLGEDAKALAARVGEASESAGRELARLDAKTRAALAEWASLWRHPPRDTGVGSQAGISLKEALVRARTHLLWAGTDAFSKWPPEDAARLRASARANLDKTREFLESALQHVPAHGISKSDVRALIDETDALRVNLAEAEGADMYRRLESHVRDLIQRT